MLLTAVIGKLTTSSMIEYIIYSDDFPIPVKADIRVELEEMVTYNLLMGDRRVSAATEKIVTMLLREWFRCG